MAKHESIFQQRTTSFWGKMINNIKDTFKQHIKPILSVKIDPVEKVFSEVNQGGISDRRSMNDMRSPVKQESINNINGLLPNNLRNYNNLPQIDNSHGTPRTYCGPSV